MPIPLADERALRRALADARRNVDDARDLIARHADELPNLLLGHYAAQLSAELARVTEYVQAGLWSARERDRARRPVRAELVPADAPANENVLTTDDPNPKEQ